MMYHIADTACPKQACRLVVYHLQPHRGSHNIVGCAACAKNVLKVGVVAVVVVYICWYITLSKASAHT